MGILEGLKRARKSLWEDLKRARKSFVEGGNPSSYSAGGRTLACPHCGGARFSEGWARLNTPSVATTLICERCGLVQWFGLEPQRLPAKPGDHEDWPEL